jgi:hypothetical protein
LPASGSKAAIFSIPLPGNALAAFFAQGNARAAGRDSAAFRSPFLLFLPFFALNEGRGERATLKKDVDVALA